MSTVFDIHNLKLPKLSRASLIIGALLVVLGLVAAFVGREIYTKLTNNTVVVYLPEANALYSGDEVSIMGAPVGAIDKIEPAGNTMKVTFHYANEYKVPADASVVVLNPTLVASRSIQLEPPYRGGPVLGNGAVIPIERTQVPAEWDDLRDSVTEIVDKLGPTPEQPRGPFGDLIESFADGLAGKGKQLNVTFNNLSQALAALNEGRGDFFAVVRSLALFVNALHQNDQQFVALNKNLAQLTNSFTNSDRELADALQRVDPLLSTVRKWFVENRKVLAHDINNLVEVTDVIVEPVTFDALETVAHVLPQTAANVLAIYEPTHGALTGAPAIADFANPIQFICSSIQASSRLGYQDSAELCAQYLAPVLDAIKFNYLPFGLNVFSTADTLPKYVDYSEERLRPPPGYKDTTVPGIWVPDTPLSHRNTQPGWIVAPGMQGVRVQPDTARLLTPESLAELMGGPDIEPVQSQYQTPPGPPNAYDENMAAPVIGMPIPWPAPAPAGGSLPAEAPAPQGAGQ